MDTYKIVKVYAKLGSDNRTIARGLSLERAKEICSDPKSKYDCKKHPDKSWMYVFYKE